MSRSSPMSQRIATALAARGADRVDGLVDRPRKLARRLLAPSAPRTRPTRPAPPRYDRQPLADAARRTGHHDHLAVELPVVIAPSWHAPGPANIDAASRWRRGPRITTTCVRQYVMKLDRNEMTDITDEYMREMLAQAKGYTLVLLKAGRQLRRARRRPDDLRARPAQLRATRRGRAPDRVPGHRRHRVGRDRHLRRARRRGGRASWTATPACRPASSPTRSTRSAASPATRSPPDPASEAGTRHEIRRRCRWPRPRGAPRTGGSGGGRPSS